jgi:hypothetical protein
MTRQERGKLGNQAMSRKARERAEALRGLLDEGECLKRAAFKAGMAYRTARRWRGTWR